MPSLKNPIKNDKSLHFFLSQKIPSPSKSKIQSKKGSVSTTPDRVSVDPSPNNPNLGPFLLKLARDSIGEDLDKALEYALRASIWFERNSGSGLDLAVSLHVVAAVYCGLGRFEDAVPVLKKAIEVVDVGSGSDHAMAKFSGFMQLGDAYFMLGQLDRSISCYESGLRIQIECLRDSDIRVAETCRYLAEAYIQAMQFDEAEKLCSRTLEIHREHNEPASLEEAADRQLLAFVCEAKGDYESALDHLVLASVAMNAAGLENDVAAIDVSIGNTYVYLGRFDEAVFSYQKALTVFKSTKGDGHPSVASAFIRLADVYYKTGKLRESKSYCENALRIYANPALGITSQELAVGLTELAVIYEGLNEPEEALKLLDKAMKILEHTPGQQSTVAGIEAQMGVMFYMIGRFKEARNSYENAIAKLRGTGENRSAFFGILLNQMGLASVQLYKIDEATKLFEEARGMLEQECGPFHPDTLGVYSNLAATYDALGRVEDAIELLEYILKVRQEKLGTANPDVDDEKKRLAELLKEAGRAWNPKVKSLKNLLGSKPRMANKNTTEKRPGFSFGSC